MTQIGAIDMQVMAALATGLFLFCCVVLFYCIRDTTSAPLRRVTRTVWCPTRERRAIVDFNERVVTGIAIRKVEGCSLLEHGERCSGPCVTNLGLETEGRSI